MNSDKLTSKSAFFCVCSDLNAHNDLNSDNSNTMNVNISDCQLTQNENFCNGFLIDNNKKVNEVVVTQDENVAGDNVPVAANLKNSYEEKGTQTDNSKEVKIEKEKRPRTVYTTAQKEVLEREFNIDHFIVGSRKKSVAQSLNMTERQVKVWFQNRRNKEKEKLVKKEVCVEETPNKSSSSTDPHPQTNKKPKKKKESKKKSRKPSAPVALSTTNSQSDITSSCNNVTESGNDQNQQQTNNNDPLYLNNAQQQYYTNQNLQNPFNFNQFYDYQFPVPYPIKVEPSGDSNYFSYNNNNQLPNSFNYNYDLYNRNSFQGNICCCCPHVKNENYFQAPQNFNAQDEALSNWIHFVLKNM